MSDVETVLSQVARSSARRHRNGLWVGRVENIDDPERINRMQVRVFAIHGDNTQTPTADLPWAELCDLSGGGPDYGSGGRQYPVGSTVWVMFELADEALPVIMGGRRGSAPIRDPLNPIEFNTVGKQDPSFTETPWLPAEENELPKDVFEDSADGDNHPTRVVWQKSFKGHTIVVEDRDETEFLRIIDRAGQTIEMNCPVLAEENEDNAAQRGTKSSINNDQLSQDQLVNGRAFIRLKDVSGQEILLDGASNNEKIQITSRSRQGSAVQRMTLSSKKGEEKIEITDKNGNTFLFDSNSPTPIKLTDSAGDEISFEVEEGLLKIASVVDAAEEVGRDKDVSVSGASTKTVGGDQTTQILGNNFHSVLTDMALSVQGLTSAILTGPVSVQVVNTQFSGAAADNALSLGMAIGGVDINSQVCGTGKMHFGTLAGDVEVDTVAGNMNVGTAAGSSRLRSTLGCVIEDPVSVKIGSDACVEPLVLGNQFYAMMNQLFLTLSANFVTWGALGQVPIPAHPALIGALTAWYTTWIATPPPANLMLSSRRFTEK